VTFARISGLSCPTGLVARIWRRSTFLIAIMGWYAPLRRHTLHPTEGATGYGGHCRSAEVGRCVLFAGCDF
jgi:hypothetical protein